MMHPSAHTAAAKQHTRLHHQPPRPHQRILHAQNNWPVVLSSPPRRQQHITHASADAVQEAESVETDLDSTAKRQARLHVAAPTQQALKQQSHDAAIDRSNDTTPTVTTPVPSANAPGVDLDAQIRALFFPAMVTFSLDPLLGAVDTGM